MSGKRPHQFGDADNDAKRIRSNNGSPVPASGAKTGTEVSNEATPNPTDRVAVLQARLAAAKARSAELKSAKSAVAAIPPTAAQDVPTGEEAKRIAATPRPTPEEDAKKAAALQQIAALKARAAAQRKPITPSPANVTPNSHQFGIAEAARRAAELAKQRNATTSPALPTLAQQDVAHDLQKRIAEARARKGELERQRSGKADTDIPPPPQDKNSSRGNGLGIGIHPSLLSIQEPTPAKSKAQGPKFSTTKGNQVVEPEPEDEVAAVPQRDKVNPYLDAGNPVDNRHDHTFDPRLASKIKSRQSRPIEFVAKGTYVAQSIALQEQADLEAMKRRITLEAKKMAIEQASDKSFLVPAPPEIEWWDETYLQDDHKSYDDWEQHNTIEGKDSTITAYVQHPVLVAAPQDKFMPAPKPMMLTKKETKKIRRQRRMVDMKEEQAKIRLGLLAPPPPKVKKSNMMSVYGEQAVKDPTAVEARVNREIAERLANHEQANAERQLTKEQRAEKLKQQQVADEAKGIKIAVFRVDSLSSGKHRYQVDHNAKEYALHGIVILHPKMNLVLIEGGVHAVTAYKKLMLNRIKWSENTMPLSNHSNPTYTATASRSSDRDLIKGPSATDTWLNPMTEHGELKDLSENRCMLVWEGDLREHVFKRWGSRVCETDGEARDALAPSRMQNMWELAKGMNDDA